MRRLYVIELFSIKRVQSFRFVREEEVEFLIKSISEFSKLGTPVNLSEKLMSLTADITCRVAFGKSFRERAYEDFGADFGADFEEVIHEAIAMLGSFAAADFFPYFGWIVDRMTGLHTRLERSFKKLDAFFQKVLDDHLCSGRQITEEEQEDIIDVLIKIGKYEKASGTEKITHNHIKAILMDLFLAGSDTSAISMAWAMAELAKNPRVMKKAQEEIRNSVGNKGKVSETDIEKLPYLKAVVKENWRLHPPATLLLAREAITRFYVSGYIIDSKTRIQVAAVPEDVGTAGAIRAIAHHLTAEDILVVSGDLVSDVPPGAVVASHRHHGAAVTVVLCSAPVSGALESGSGGGKDKIKKPGRYDITGRDTTKQFLLCIATGGEIEKDTRIQKTIPLALGQMEIRSDRMDAHMYAFKRSVLQGVLDQKYTFQSLKQDVLPYLVWSQLRLYQKYTPLMEENGNQKISTLNNQATLPQILANASTPSFYELYELGSNGSAPIWEKIKCCAYIASNSKYCARLNSIQAFMDINRDIISEANHLSGHSFSAHNNIIHPSAELGSKTTVSPL
ncbi:hypothetical protein SLEP1_g14067 [Rubroshorea leprosula]|uniref:Translation initiation factor eIF2B subunit gamma n=1 Tax=Rubroshorea leprosula TaxID=152421 RepID=A0AAV5IQT2_9ROSI|nr:hypothetical protein SLEP1_g14067 [Rubroshorea leprosula]